MQNNVKKISFGFGVTIGPVKKPWSTFHRHEDVQLGFYTKGTVLYHLGRHAHSLEEGDMVMAWAGIPHMLRDAPDNAQQYWMTVPLEYFLAWNIPKHIINSLFSGELLVVKNKCRVERERQFFAQLQEDLATKKEAYASLALLYFEARFRRFCLDYEQQANKKSSVYQEDSSSFARMCQFINDNYKKAISVSDVAEYAGLHPYYAMNLFKSNCAYTIKAMLTTMRINEAQRLLSTTDTPITDVAFEAGFQSMSVFYATFKKHCSVTPKDYRSGFEIYCNHEEVQL